MTFGGENMAQNLFEFNKKVIQNLLEAK